MAKKCRSVICGAFLMFAASMSAQERHMGTAVVVVGDGEYTIPIECNDASRPELGFYTEASRITRERTGRSSGIRLIVRPWRDTADLIISLGRYVAWVPQEPSTGGVLTMTLDMSPASNVRDGMPVALTYDMWLDGERPEGITGVKFEAVCGQLDDTAPAYRKLPVE